MKKKLLIEILPFHHYASESFSDQAETFKNEFQILHNNSRYNYHSHLHAILLSSSVRIKL